MQSGLLTSARKIKLYSGIKKLLGKKDTISNITKVDSGIPKISLKNETEFSSMNINDSSLKMTIVPESFYDVNVTYKDIETGTSYTETLLGYSVENNIYFKVNNLPVIVDIELVLNSPTSLTINIDDKTSCSDFTINSVMYIKKTLSTIKYTKNIDYPLYLDSNKLNCKALNYTTRYGDHIYLGTKTQGRILCLIKNNGTEQNYTLNKETLEFTESTIPRYTAEIHYSNNKYYYLATKSGTSAGTSVSIPHLFTSTNLNSWTELNLQDWVETKNNTVLNYSEPEYVEIINNRIYIFEHYNYNDTPILQCSTDLCNTLVTCNVPDINTSAGIKPEGASSWSVYSPTIIYKFNKYFMYFNGPTNLYYISTDGINFTKYTHPTCSYISFSIVGKYLLREGTVPDTSTSSKYKREIVEVSSDGVTWKTLIDNDRDITKLYYYGISYHHGLYVSYINDGSLSESTADSVYASNDIFTLYDSNNIIKANTNLMGSPSYKYGYWYLTIGSSYTEYRFTKNSLTPIQISNTNYPTEHYLPVYYLLQVKSQKNSFMLCTNTSQKIIEAPKFTDSNSTLSLEYKHDILLLNYWGGNIYRYYALNNIFNIDMEVI